MAQAGRLGAVTVATNMAGRGVDIVLGGNPEIAGRDRRPEPRGSTSRPRKVEARFEKLARQVRGRDVQAEGDEGQRARRPLRAGHRTPRAPPHRQPAPWPCRPPGRPRREPFLPVARRRPHAAVRHRRHELGDGQGPARRRAHRVQDGHQGDRAGPEHRRAAQRRDPQERPQVRRGHERAAQGHLRRRDQILDGEDLRDEALEAHRPTPSTSVIEHLLRRRYSRGVGHRRPAHRARHLLADRAHRRQTRRAADATDEICELLMAEARPATTSSARPRSAPSHAPDRAPGDAAHHRSALARAPLRDGLPPARASTCGPWARRIRSSSGSAKASRCSAR